MLLTFIAEYDLPVAICCPWSKPVLPMAKVGLNCFQCGSVGHMHCI